MNPLDQVPQDVRVRLPQELRAGQDLRRPGLLRGAQREADPDGADEERARRGRLHRLLGLPQLPQRRLPARQGVGPRRARHQGAI